MIVTTARIRARETNRAPLSRRAFSSPCSVRSCVKIGMNAAERAPSAKNTRKRFGMPKAT
jgi:hypothetical protein